MRVGGVAVTGNFAINFRAALFRVFQFFQNQNARAFAHDKSVTIFVERTRGVFGIVVARAHRAHGAKSADADGNNRRFGTAREHHGCVARFNRAPRFADGVIRRRARGAGRKIRSAQIEIHRDEAGCHVPDEHRNGERRHPPWTAFEQNFMLLARRRQPANAGAEEHANFVEIFFFQFEAGIFQRAPASVNAKLRIAIRAADFLRRRKGGRRIKVFHLARDLRGEGRRVESRNFINAALAGN